MAKPGQSSAPGWPGSRVRRTGARDGAIANAYTAARLALVKALMRIGWRDLIRHLAHWTVEYAPPNWPRAIAVGNLLFKLGEFDAAHKMLKIGLERTPLDTDALRTMSALLYRHGDKAAAHRSLVTAARINPIAGPSRPDSGKPMILRMRAVDNNRYAIVYDSVTGHHKRLLKGGHFAIKNLVDKSRVNLYVADFVGGHLPSAAQIPKFDLAINTVSCAERNAAALRQIDRFLAQFTGVHVINNPRKVLETTRERNACRLGSLGGVRLPRTELFLNNVPPTVVANRLEARGFYYPLLVRLPGTHTGVSLSKAVDRNALLERLEAMPNDVEFYAIEYLDCRDQNGHYHKTRAFFIDGVFYPVANLTSDVWQIHSGDRYRVMVDCTSSRSAEKRYLQDPEAYLGAEVLKSLHDVNRVIGLDFFGIDFTIDRTGRLIVFEANAAMRHNFDHVGAFPYTQAYLEQISWAFERMVEERITLSR